ncbi:stage 0 sporulation family protein [Candidatus Chlorohelix sp.]|uniref:PSP1 domain-containing protein n=1 Tax=Candidatus Chlorohelix sp. TaxID=3139201 RepID=UPI003065220F
MTTQDIQNQNKDTFRTVAVRFKPNGKLQYFDPGELELKPDDWVVIEVGRNTEMARVVLPPRSIVASQLAEPLKPILRIANEDDINRQLSYRARNKDSLVKCAERVKVYLIPMRLVECEWNYDGSKVTFFFTADTRVDFRQLVRDLASIFRTRIELRQIGVRDKAKLVGGVGKCGETLCCSTWSSEFPPVSIKTAKDQDLPLNPSKITGVCGRLLCCLSYEHPMYEKMKENMPKVGDRVCGAHGSGAVVGRNILKQTVTVTFDNGAFSELPHRELTIEEKEQSTLVAGYDADTDTVFEVEDPEDLQFLKED